MNVLVIGASRGLGRELVQQALAAGDRVTATARRADDVAALQALGAQAFMLDVADAVSASGLAWRIDGAGFDQAWLVAGVYGPRTQGLASPTEADFDAVMHTNLLGAMRVLPQLADAFAPGARLGVLSSRMGSIGLRNGTAGWLYRASKAALNSVVRDAALEWAGRVTVVAFHPGWVQTDMGGRGADLTVERSAADLRRTLAGLGPADTGRFLNHDGEPLAW
ncbi:SDR family oxidoreductase [Piscinibacter sakaiensis]|uniref:Dehydrogenase with different specificities n=1 Tax=Piscinibacter sakaiensis TaxID=1547922 RepID=A0A0K8P0X6_PISS1|nr:SDR family oxidoreductase [Piscinibacter sakaiensis]GAP35825.1 dehydrogenase with different specificities [Piscinibacter sakaiensis]